MLLLGLRGLLDIPSDILGNVYWARRSSSGASRSAAHRLLIEALATVGALLLNMPPVLLATVPLAPSIYGFFLICCATFGAAIPTSACVPDSGRCGAAPDPEDGLVLPGAAGRQLLSFQGLTLILGAVARGPFEVVIFTAIRTVASLLRQVIERVGGLTRRRA